MKKFGGHGTISYAIVEDVALENAFDKAVQSSPSFEAVIHSASPFHNNITDPRKDILDPAIQGTKGILRAIKLNAPSVRRVVITSSLGAMLNAGNHPAEYNESIWNPTTFDQAVSDLSTTYNASKKLAEAAAWEFVREEKPQYTVATINPPFVFGPPLHDVASLKQLNTSNKRILMAIDGSFKQSIPPTGSWMWVDVRDVARAHVRAMERVEAGGRRFLMVGSYWTNKDMVEIIRDRFPALRPNLPGKIESDMPDKIFAFDNYPSKEILGIQYHSLDQCIVDSVNGLLRIDGSLVTR